MARRASISKCLRQRRKSFKNLWSPKSKKTRRPTQLFNEIFYLPTRETLTYAEAQKLVDVDVDGELHRLNICQPLEIIDSIPDDGEISVKDCALIESHLRNEKVQCAAGEDASNGYSLGVPAALSKPSYRIIGEDQFVKPVSVLPELKRRTAYYRMIDQTAEELNNEIEYDMDEQDVAWLKMVNTARRRERLVPMSVDDFELTVDRLEKQSFQINVAGGEDKMNDAANGDRSEVTACAVCGDGEDRTANVIVMCDLCDIRVHQDCYGIPFRPEGSWLCRKCLRSPQTDVNCCMCPNSGGAFKQTTDGLWVHVLCALSLPEVKFISSIALEPVNIDRVPASRLSLTCAICKIRARGACVLCQANGCHTAFHATCVSKAAGFVLNLERIPTNGSRMNVRKTFFCAEHGPPATIPAVVRHHTSAVTPAKSKTPHKLTSTSKIKKSLGAESLVLATEAISPPVPTISQKWLKTMSEQLSVRDKNRAMSLVHNYWQLKRIHRNGLPLLQRLNLTTHRACSDTRMNEDGLSVLKRIRQNMEKVRLLLELIRKREKVKVELLKCHEMVINFKLRPMSFLFQNIIDQLQAKDPSGIFAYPVSVEEVPDYLDTVKQPMDFSTMREKIEAHTYKSVDDLDADFQLIISNCLTYNSPDSVLHKIALSFRTQGASIISAARRMCERAGYCCDTGLHMKDDKSTVNGPTCCELDMNIPLTCKPKTDSTDESLESQVEVLQRQLDVAQVIRSLHSARLVHRLRKQIQMYKRVMARQKTNCVGEPGLLDDVSYSDAAANNETAACQAIVRNFKTSLNVNIKAEVVDISAIELRRSALVKQVSDSNSDTKAEFFEHGSTRGFFEDTSHRRNSTLRSRTATSTVSGMTRSKKSFFISPSQSNVVTKRRLRADSISPQSPAELLPVLRRLCSADIDAVLYAKSMISTVSMGSRSAGKVRRRVSRRSVPVVASSLNESSVGSSVESSLGSLVESVSCDSVTSTDTEQYALKSYSFAKVEKRRSIHSFADSIAVQPSEVLPMFAQHDIVWAKTRGFPWYPAMVVKSPTKRVKTSIIRGYDRMTVAPPADVLALRYKYSGPVYLIRFFDKRRNWQWLTKQNLEPLGVNASFDNLKMTEVKAVKLRADIRRAYSEAVRCYRRLHAINCHIVVDTETQDCC